jgi:transposase
MSPKKEYSFEVVDHCEALYVVDGKTYEEIAKSSGVSIAQVQRWADKYEWRKKKEERKSETLKAQSEARSPVREKILLDLKKQKERYDKFFETLGDDEINTQATYAHATLCKTISDIQKDLDAKAVPKIDRPQIFVDFMRDLVVFLKDRDPAALQELEKNFDEFIQFAKEKYAKD